jgi:hypothetical protein
VNIQPDHLAALGQGSGAATPSAQGARVDIHRPFLTALLATAFSVHGAPRAQGLPADQQQSQSSTRPWIFRSQAKEIELALSSGPEHLRADSTVYVFGVDGYQRARVGSNGFTCLVNRDGYQSGEEAIRPTCWDAEGSATILPVMLRVGELIAKGRSASEIERDIDAGFAAGRFSSPHKAGIAYMLRGDVLIDPNTEAISRTLFPPHYMFYAPGISDADIGIDAAADKDRFALPFVYDGYSGGTRTGYIIVLASESRMHAH